MYQNSSASVSKSNVLCNCVWSAFGAPCTDGLHVTDNLFVFVLLQELVSFIIDNAAIILNNGLMLKRMKIYPVKRSTVVLILYLISFYSFAQSTDKKFTRPKATPEVRNKIKEADIVFGTNNEKGIAEMKDVISYCIAKEYDGIDLFDPHYSLAILYYRLPEMDSALYFFRKCLEIATKNEDHYLSYKAYIGLFRVKSYLGFYDSATYFANEGLKHSTAINYAIGIANNYTQLGVVAGHQGHVEKANYYKEKTFEVAKANNDTMGIFNGAYNLAVHYLKGKYYQKSLEYGVYAEKFSRHTRFDYQRGLANSVLSQVYTELGDYEKALSYSRAAVEKHQKAIENSESESHISWVVFCYYYQGIIYTSLDSTNKARRYLRKAILYYDSTQQLESRADAYVKYSDTYRNEGRYDSALFYARIARKLGDATDHILERKNGNLCLAQVHYELASYDSARHYGLIALKLSEDNGYYESIGDAAKVLFNVYEKSGDTDKALYYLKQLSAVKDTLDNEQRVKAATKVSMQYEFDKEKQQFAFEKEKETLLLNQQIDRQKAIQYGAFGGIILLSIVFYGYYRSYKSKQKDHQKIAEQSIELKEKNEKLNELSKYKEGLSHMIVHDMKNPLNVILGLTGDKVPDAEKSQLINESAKLILQLAHDIIDIQKFEEAKMKLEYETYTVREVVLYAEEQVDLMMRVKNMTFDNDLDADLKASFDLRLMTRVLVNLFTNAVKYSPVGSQLTVTVREQKDGQFEFLVADKGQGIPEDQLPYIFDKFWQVYSKKSANTYSSGLGLTFCRLAVQAHGGTIEASSTLGEGSEFKIVLPVGEVDQAQGIMNKQEEAVSKDSDRFYSEEEEAVLNTLIGKIAGIPIYKAGVINKILDEADSESVKITEWIQMIKFAVMSWDQQRFDELLRIGNNEPEKTGTYN